MFYRLFSYMNRLERLSAILIHLQSKKVVTAAEIAERFGISIRTIYRDVNALIEAGVPVGSEAGVGYFLVEGYKLPPVMFSSEEAIALIIAEKLINSFPDRFTKKHFQDALYKIKAVLKSHQKDEVAALSDNLRIFSGSALPEPKEYPFLQTIQQAIIQKKIVEIVYKALSDDKPQQRDIEPIGLCNYMQEWHVIAWCHLRNDYRDFRLDRMLSATLSQQTYVHEQKLTIDDYFKNWFSNLNLIEIQIAVHADMAQQISNSKYWYGFIREEPFENAVAMTFLNADLQGFARWLLMLGGRVKILQPLNLQQIYVQLVERLYKAL